VHAICHGPLRNIPEVHVHDNGIDFKKIFSKMLDYFRNFWKLNPSKISHYTICSDSKCRCFLTSNFHPNMDIQFWNLTIPASNGHGVNGQGSTQLETSTWLTSELGHPIGYYLWCLELKWASGETIWQCSTFMHGKPHRFVSPHCPQPPPLCNHLWYWCKNYLKWQAIQLAALYRVVQLKDIICITMD